MGGDYFPLEGDSQLQIVGNITRLLIIRPIHICLNIT